MLAVSGPVYKCGQNSENSVGVCTSYRSVSGYQGAQFVVAHYKRSLVQDTVQIGTLLLVRQYFVRLEKKFFFGF